MNIAILIFTLFLFGLALCFAFLYVVEKYKASQRIHRNKIIKLTKEYNLLKNKVEIIGSSPDKKPPNIKTPNYKDNMENRKIRELKQVVIVGDEERKVG